jgi:hypothetical protein
LLLPAYCCCCSYCVLVLLLILLVVPRGLAAEPVGPAVAVGDNGSAAAIRRSPMPHPLDLEVNGV